ncbi:MAG: hypothetical protein ACTSUE_04560 [Promethearchaeota archaeon]
MMENVEEEPEKDEKQVKNLTVGEMWDEIGFHKPMAGLWNNVGYTLITIVLSAVLMGYLISFFYPFPSSLGIKDIAFGVFSLMFSLFDMGTGAVMGRFIPEANIKNPERMLHYIQYFIWYQMITGIVQTTFVSIYAIFFAPASSMGYTVWIMLIASTTQYPGFLGCFRGVLSSLQHYDKEKILNFITGTLFQNFTNFLFVYLGRLWGEKNINMGPILSIAIGAAIGSYVDDFFATMLSAFFFKNMLKPYGITPRHCFRREFTWEEIKPVLWYSFRTGAPAFITGPLSYTAFLITINYIPHYTTIAMLIVVGGSIGDVMSWFGNVSITPLVSESYMNNKESLTQYYVGQKFRFNSLIIGLFAPLTLILSFVMPDAWGALNMGQYTLASLFIMPRFIRYAIERYLGTAGEVMYGANKPNFGIVMGIIQTILDLGVKYLLYVYLAIPARYGLAVTILVMEFGHLPVSIVMNIISYTYVHKKIIPIKIPTAQIIIGMLIPAVITFLVMFMIYSFIFLPLLHAYNFYIALGPGIGGIAICIFFVYFPLTGIFGAWDDVNLEEFKKSAKMSGISIFFVAPIRFSVIKGCKISKLHNRFAMPIEDVEKNARELLEIKRQNRDLLRKRLLAGKS